MSKRPGIFRFRLPAVLTAKRECVRKGRFSPDYRYVTKGRLRRLRRVVYAWLRHGYTTLTLSTLSQKSETVAANGETTATVSLFCDSVDTGQALRQPTETVNSRFYNHFDPYALSNCSTNHLNIPIKSISSAKSLNSSGSGNAHFN